LNGEAHLALAQLAVERGHAAEGVAMYQRWLNGKPAGVEQIEAVARLALRAHQYNKALDATKQVIRAGVLNHPAGPPPVRLLHDLVQSIGDPALTAKVDAALAHCNRVDCVQRELGW
jgi:DNA-binding SARP family transcriptional activator